MRTLEENRKNYKIIKSESHKVKDVMERVHDWKKRNVLETQCSRIQNQLKMMASLDRKNKKAHEKLKIQLKSLEKSEKVYEKKMKIYASTLKDGSTLKKMKPRIS